MTTQLDAPSCFKMQSPRERYDGIISHVAGRWGVCVEDIKGPSRSWPVKDARWECCEALEEIGLSSVRVGRLLGLDPSSVRYALMMSRQRRDDAQ